MNNDRQRSSYFCSWSCCCSLPATPLPYGFGIWPISGGFCACFYVFFFFLFFSSLILFFFFLVLFILGVSDRRKLVAASCSARFGSPVAWLVGWLVLVGGSRSARSSLLNTLLHLSQPYFMLCHFRCIFFALAPVFAPTPQLFLAKLLFIVRSGKSYRSFVHVHMLRWLLGCSAALQVEAIEMSPCMRSSLPDLLWQLGLVVK